MAILLLTGGCERPKRPAMKRIVESKQTPLRLVPIAVVHAGIRSGELKRAFPCFRSAVAEKSAIKAGDLRKLLRQLCLIFVIEEVRSMNQLRCLMFQDSLNRRVRMAQRIHANSTEEIEIALPFRVPEINPAPAREEHLLAVVGLQ